MSRIQRTLYRLFMRHVSNIEKNGLEIHVGLPMDKAAWLANGGQHGWTTPSPEYNKESLKSQLPWLTTSSECTTTGSFTPHQLRQCIRNEFRHPSPTSSSPSSHNHNSDSELLDRAFIGLRILEEQLYMAQCSSSAVSNNIRVDVTTAFVGTQNELDPTFDPENDDGPQKYYFTYRVRISNIGQQTVQLLSRHWLIKNQQGNVIAEVAKGARGVVGCTPILKPNTCFVYYSGTDMDSPGSMEGSFEMAVLNSKGIPEEKFEAEIAPFKFIMPASSSSTTS